MDSIQSRLDKLSTARRPRRPSPHVLALIFIVVGLFVMSLYSSSTLVESDGDDRLAKRSHSVLLETDFIKQTTTKRKIGGELSAASTIKENLPIGSPRGDDEEYSPENNPQGQTYDTPPNEAKEDDLKAQVSDGIEMEGSTNDTPLSTEQAQEDDFPPLDPSEEKLPDSSQQLNDDLSPLVNVDRNSDFYKQFYASRFLPSPQLDFFPRTGRQIKYQMHNCLKGRDGSKAGLVDAGIPRVLSQKSLENMPLHIIDPWSSIMVACNAKKPMYELTRNPRVAGKRLISSAQGLLSKLCLGSMKTKQLECRRDLTAKWGCSYESLGIQPAQFVLYNPDECKQFLEEGHKRDRAWLSKPSGGIRGRGIKYYANTQQLEREIQTKGGCAASNATGLRGRLVQEYVAEPALIDGKFKFDIRTWLLVASVDPLVIFYHEGFVRVAKQPYNEKSHSKMVHITNARGQNAKDDPGARDRVRSSGDDGDDDSEDDEDGKYMRSFDHVSEQLYRHHGLPKDFMQNSYRRQMMRAQMVAALAQFATLPDPEGLFTKKGFYQIYACDSMVDRTGKAHLLECNGFPAEAQQTAVTGREIWGEMIALLLNLHVEPWRLMNDTTPPPGVKRFRYVRNGIWKTGPSNLLNGESFTANSYAFGGWHLVFNELETPLSDFNVCKM